jgi:hypothetical protein
MGHFVRQDSRQLRTAVGERDQAAGDIQVAARQREGVGHRRIQDGDLVAPRRVVGCGDQAGNDARHRLFDGAIGIDAAIFGDDAGILARADRFFGGVPRRARRRDHRDRFNAVGRSHELATSQKRGREKDQRRSVHGLGNAQVQGRNQDLFLGRGVTAEYFDLHRRRDPDERPGPLFDIAADTKPLAGHGR